MRLLLLLVLLSLVYGKELKFCQKGYYLLFPVGYSCTTYAVKDGKLFMSGWTKSSFIGAVVKKLRLESEAVASLSFTSERFLARIKTPKYEKLHRYAFKGNEVYYEIRVVENGKEKVKKGTLRVSSPVDPFLAGVLLYLTADEREREIRFFYDGLEQRVVYRVVGRETLERMGREWKTLKVEVKPFVKTEGLLKPKGSWLVWIDEETRLPVRLKVSFVIGSANVWIDALEGDETLLKSLKEALEKARGGSLREGGGKASALSLPSRSAREAASARP
ncbi:MAG: DUF3108 domain-containing protein [Aquificae bacterium]|nr:DUF3108 domain-containing protein [Aquificota bacterium]